MPSTSRRLLLLCLMGLVGALVSGCTGCARMLPGWPLGGNRLRAHPLPHHVPKYAGGVTLRFAMVHDMIHERYSRHGKAYYAKRNRLAREALAAEAARIGPEGKPTATYFALTDDLGAGLDFLGEHDEAVRVLREKLARQVALGLSGRELYTTYANLGTFLIHGSFRAAAAGDAAAKDRLREGLGFIHQSIAVNPEAHFGREVWQAAVVEFFLAALDDPELLLRYDLVGNRLDRALDPRRQSALKDRGRWARGLSRMAADDLKGDLDPWDRGRYREEIAQVGAEEGWAAAVRGSHKAPVAFDEPTLGLLGMWRQGGGANPYSALTLGEIMLRVGQRYVAWCAYERAVLLADRFSPDATIRVRFVQHCRRRQQVLEEQLPAADWAELRPRFEFELRHGQGYQQAFQQYEANAIAAGKSLESADFYDAFHREHPAIASPVGNEDAFLVRSDSLNWPLPGMLLGAGLFAVATACVLRLRSGRGEATGFSLRGC